MLKRIDLSRDYQKHKEEYKRAIEEVCESTAFSGGPYADRFAEEFARYIGVEYMTGVNNGTSALHLAMLALGIGEGDEVIVPANTYIATAWGISYTGAKPVFVDCTTDTWEIDPEKAEVAITERTKAIVGVHLYGQPFEFNKIKEIANKYGLHTIEDVAQAAGAEYEGVKCGNLADISCFSFYPGKNLYSFGEGGAVGTNNKEWIDKINVYKEQGCRVRYHHEVIGYNMRLEGIQGAVLSVGLRHLDEWTERRRAIGMRYDAEITNPLIKKQFHPDNTKHVYHLYETQVPDPRHFLEYMKENDIECHRHYPIPCHLQEAYRSLGFKRGDCPNAELLADHCVTLPLFPEMKDEEVALVIEKCNVYKAK
ncbi:MAG: DegT/DnrJ/EryC1/StrS family aminotransferase [Lachnospiraceae bacterium]|nr:DegT/DnrJ/EryC1/StrS family aminotransferase [Lachnospiraceae bacterium]